MLPSIIRVVYADNQPVARDGMEKAFDQAFSIEVVKAVEDYNEVLHLLATTKVNVVVLDILGMRGSPLETINRIEREHPGVQVVMFSSSVAMLPEMLRAGAKGYVVKDELTDCLVDAIRTVHAGGTFLSPLAQTYMDNFNTNVERCNLTRRELAVLAQVYHGHKTMEIAEHLTIDPRSVRNYIYQIRKKTGCETWVDMSNFYRRLYGHDQTVALDEEFA